MQSLPQLPPGGTPSPGGAGAVDHLQAAAARGKLNLSTYGRGAGAGRVIADGVLDRLDSVGTWTAISDQEWGLGWHRNEGIEFTCVTAGSVAFSCEGEEFELVAGDITITRPWQLHKLGRPDVTTSTLTWFIIDVGASRPNQEWRWPAWLPMATVDIARLTELLSQNERPVWRANQPVLDAVATLERTLHGNLTQPMSRIAMSVTGVLIELGDLVEQQSPRLDPYLSSSERAVQLFLRRLVNRVDEPWTVEKMALACGLGRTRFIHYCRKYCNVAPLEYLTEIRLQQAQTMLIETELRITEVSSRCGFQSSQYFATVFRRRFQQSPKEFRLASRLHA